MRVKSFRTIILALATLHCVSGNASAAVQLRRLSSNQAQIWSRSNQAGAELFILFQAECLSCRKQVKQLGCLEGTNIKLRFLAEDSNRKALITEARRMGVLSSAFAISKQDLQKLGLNEPATPQGLLYWGEKSVKWLGVKTCENLKELFGRGSKTNEEA